jgi:prepilin signal peptidase PulO-like enzyme (type II secretory pathway)
METVVTSGILALFGLLFGSFAGAQVWRLRARQLRDEDQLLVRFNEQKTLTADEAQERDWLIDETADRRAERARLDSLLNSPRHDYSRCLSCQHRLAWYDLVPLISWASTAGKCRYCGVRIGPYEPLMEAGVAVAFAVSYIFWPFALDGFQGILFFGLWLIALVLLAVLFAYDLKWFLLPDSIVFSLVGVGAAMVAVRLVGAQNAGAVLISTGGGVAVLSGLYFLLHHLSRRQWVGLGDVKLGLGLALLLADWRLALLTLFLANLLGSLVVLPAMVRGKLDRKTHIPFGPLLIIATVIALLAGERIVDWYMGFLV